LRCLLYGNARPPTSAGASGLIIRDSDPIAITKGGPLA